MFPEYAEYIVFEEILISKYIFLSVHILWKFDVLETCSEYEIWYILWMDSVPGTFSECDFSGNWIPSNFDHGVFGENIFCVFCAMLLDAKTLENALENM